MFENYFRILHFSSNGRYPKSTVFGHFGVQFTPGKPEKLLKPKISAETTCLELSNNMNCRSQKTHIVLVKLIKNPFFGPKVRINLPPGGRIKSQHNFSYSLRIFPQFICAKFPCLDLCHSWLTWNIPLLFFGSGPNWVHFGRFGGNNSNKIYQIKLKFGQWIIVQMSCKIFWQTQIYRDKTYKKFAFLVEVWLQFTPWSRLKSKKLIFRRKKVINWAIQITQNQGKALYHLNFQWKIQLLFEVLGCFSGINGLRV